MNGAALKEAAEWYYEASELWEDDDLDPDNHIEVVKRAFMSSDCDDFAWLLSLMTGWQAARIQWQVPDQGIGHHTVVISGDGRMLDVTGWTDLETTSRTYGFDPANAIINKQEAKPLNQFFDFDEHGIEAGMARIAAVIRNLPYAPFDEKWFREMTARPIKGADFPSNGFSTSP